MSATQLLFLHVDGGRSGPLPLGDRTRSPADISAGNLGKLFASTALFRPEACALTTHSRKWSYRELQCAVANVARQVAAGPAFHRGDPVVLLLPNSPEYIAAYYGILLAGGVVVPLSPRTETGALTQIVKSTGAATILTISSVVTMRPDLHGLTARSIDLDADDDRAVSPEVNDAAVPLAAIFFTSGSTGEPKGVMLSHDNLVANARAIQQYLRIGSDERPLCVLPFHHAFGNSVLNSHLLGGANLVLDGQPTFPETIVAALSRYECTSFSGVPDLYQSLLSHSSLGKTRLAQLRYMAVAGGSLRRRLALEVARRIAPARFFVMYGQAEATARLAFLPPERLEQSADGCIGQTIPGVTLEIVDDDGRPVADGESGELRARGPGIMLGYWNDPQGTAERIRDGWLYTGDLAARERDGSIVHKGRRNALVKIAGYRVHPAELEDYALRNLQAAEAVVVPFEKRSVGTRLALYIKPPPDGNREPARSMLSRCAAQLPRHLVPDFVQLVDEFPLNQALKVDRTQLSRMAERRARLRPA